MRRIWFSVSQGARQFGVVVLALAMWRSGGAAEFFHLSSNSHGLTGQAVGAITQGGFTLQLAAGPAGALLNENHPQGLGVDSRGVAGANDSLPTTGIDKINRITTGAAAGQSESVTFSFNRAGVIRDLVMDGVKDETLEYFRLVLPNGTERNFFDFEAVFRLQQQGFPASTLNLPNVTLMDGSADDAQNVNIAFQAGDQFRLEYGEFPFPAGYVPLENDAGNGARWEGMVIVPEPGGLMLMAIGAAGTNCCRRKRGV